jgi:5-methylcytosine-specific restriction endonuclease McrA
MIPLPTHLSPCDEVSPLFPQEWKEAYFRRNLDLAQEGYICPDCKNCFSGVKGFRQLEGDHIRPRSKGGLTVWENLTLRCKPCNLKKSNNYECA